MPSWSGLHDSRFWDEPEEVDYKNVDADFAGEQLVDFLVSLKDSGRVSAKTTCVLAFWASRAGARGDGLASLGLRPDQKSGKYSEHFDKWSGVDIKRQNFYPLYMGISLRHECSRTWGSIPCRLPHEVLRDELLTSPLPRQKLLDAASRNDLPSRYWSHRFVIGAPEGEVVHPICLYMDGVQFSRRDSVLGIWTHFLLSPKRHLLCVLKKSQLCDCGCSGWCSMHPIMSMLAWSFEHMATGVYPASRHDGLEWTADDRLRQTDSGGNLGFRGMCLFVKGDWCEFVHTLAFPSWRDKRSPCLFCKATAAELYMSRGFGPMGTPRPRKTPQDYQRSCIQCETRLTLSPAQVRLVRPKMFFDKRKTVDGIRGRCLSEDVPELGLLRLSRLEPTGEHPDVHDLQAVDGGRETTWWRRSQETYTRRRNPLFGAATGIDIDSIAIDWLHTLSLGVYQHLLGGFLWALVSVDAFDVKQTTALARLELSVAQIRSQLFNWYRSEYQEGCEHSKVQSLVSGMLGTEARPHLRLHGAETNGFLKFAAKHLAPSYCGYLDQGAKWSELLSNALELLDLIRDTSALRKMPGPGTVRFCNIISHHMAVFPELGQYCRPKHHLWMEMGAR